jgi:Zn-finger nucleic acid-binding protein
MTTDNKNKGEKDRFGDKLRDSERAREEDYFRKRERELIEKLRASAAPAEPEPCPVCKTPLVVISEGALSAKLCPAGHGAWLPAAELTAIAKQVDPQAAGRLLARLARP